MGVAHQQRLCVIQIIGVHADISCKMGSQRRHLAALSYADAITDRTTALKRAGGLQLCKVWLPVIFSVSCIVMHEKYIVRHIELPTIISRPRERTLRMGPPRRRRGRDLSTHQRGPCYRSLDSRLWFLLAFLTQASVRKIRTPSRSVAQSGSAPRSGRGGRRFKSCHSDQSFQKVARKAFLLRQRFGQSFGQIGRGAFSRLYVVLSGSPILGASKWRPELESEGVLRRARGHRFKSACTKTFFDVCFALGSGHLLVRSGLVKHFPALPWL
jgi:hypothetical protein